MHKKLITACVALVAFVAMAVVPAIASASPVVTDNGTRLLAPVPDKVAEPTIKATNTNELILNTSVGPVKCTSATLTGDLHENTGSSITGTITTAPFTGTGTSGKCTSEWLGQIAVDTSENLPWCIKSTKNADQWEIRGGSCTQESRSLTFTLTGALGTCRYTRANLLGTFSTNTSPATLTVTASQPFSKEEVSSSLCPSSGTLEAKWDLYTDNEAETPLVIS